MNAIRSLNPGVAIEVLTPDFWGGNNKDNNKKQTEHTREQKMMVQITTHLMTHSQRQKHG